MSERGGRTWLSPTARVAAAFRCRCRRRGSHPAPPIFQRSAVPYLPLTYTKTEASLPQNVNTLKQCFSSVDNYVSWAFVA